MRILLTGCPDVSSALRALNECSVYRFLTKPCKDVDLAMTIRAGLEHRRLALENRDLLQLTRRQLDELRRANQELDSFTHALAHDFCQPLQAVSVYCELLATEHGPALNEEARQWVGEAHASARRMIELLVELRQYVGFDEDPANPEEVDLNLILGGVLDDLSVVVAQSEATVRRQPLPSVHGYPARLRQLFQNLLENAIKYRADRPPEIRVFASEHAGGCNVYVWDNGLGVPNGEQDRIFEAFYRAHRHLGDRKGSGLGLAICRKVMEQHNGAISVESHPGTGTTFRLAFPGAPPAAAAECGATAPSAAVESEVCQSA